MQKPPDSGFNRVALFYDRLAQLVFGDSQQKAQHVLLPFIRENARILIIGGGSGWLLEQVLKTGKPSHILYLEASSAMLRKAELSVKPLIRKDKPIVEFRLGTEQAILPSESFDVIFTPFVLDLFPMQRLTQLMDHLKNALKQNGLWLFTDFWPVQQPVPLWQKLLLKAMYVFFGAVSGVQATQLPDFKYHFKQLNMQEKFSASFYKGMIQAKVFINSTT